MTIHPIADDHEVTHARLRDTDLTDVPSLELAASAIEIALTEPRGDSERIMRLFALAEIREEIGLRSGARDGATLPTSAKGSLAQWTAHRRPSEARPACEKR